MIKIQKEIESIWPGWKIDRMLGEGSFGKVYRIEREDYGHVYESALKVISIPQSQAEIRAAINDGMDENGITEYFYSIVEDIVEEFALMSQLKGNTNIVSYEDHAVISHGDGIGWDIFIRMELLIPLFDYLKENKLSIRDVIHLGIDMCNALEVCQKYNIIHRDIKPENIFVSDLGNFKLGDFGIARQMEKTASGLSKKGTYAYMAPEVYKGEEYNSNVDIYSLGIVLYRFLNNNRTPFLPPFPEPLRSSDRERANIMRMGGSRIPKPCHAEGRLAEIVLKACSYEPKERYESAVEFRSALESVLYDEKESKLIYPNGDVLENEKQEYLPSTEISKEVLAGVHQYSLTDTDHIYFNSEEEKLSEAKHYAEDEAKKKDEEERQCKAEAEQEHQRVVEEEIRRKREEEAARLREEELKRQDENARIQREKNDNEKEIKNSSLLNDKRKKMMIASLIFLICFGGCFAFVSYQKSLERKVPSLVNMTLEEAKKTAAGEDGKSLKIKISDRVYNDDIEKDRIISQSSDAGSILKKGDTIKVVVSKGALVTVPEVTGLSQEEAEKQLQNSGLTYEVSDAVYSDNVKKDYVISQNIASGTTIEEHATVSVVLSKGALVNVPNIVGESKEKAEKKLQEVRLQYIESESVYSDDIKKNHVVSQNIAEGSTVEEYSTVSVVMSKGVEQVKVPDLSGKTIEDAKSMLKKAKLEYDDHMSDYQYSDDVDSGHIISQSIDAGEKVDKNSKISCIISQGQKPVSKGSGGSSRKRKKRRKKGGSSDSRGSWTWEN